ncbi:MAG: oxidoreductase [Novosphingobium pentaromativorans]|uniref:Oxidoreductase n=1 Tax=Novosphingobium pentaromativorans TaxID=205844 RepID=A0A2W5NFC3_9SPHN|nr:MAG: oxidoreductase [Novosphingobium pentaromativorans]
MATTLPLNNGVAMPALGFGVFQTSPTDTVSSVVEAIRVGYRLIDTAAIYGNEREVGEAIRQSGIDRGELFVTTKLWISEYGDEDAVRRACDRSLAKLGLDYIDLYLLHWPLHDDFEATVSSYKGLEQLLADGKVRAIGVSNFSAEHLDSLIDQVSVTPAVNQIELHPYFSQNDMRAVHADKGIVTQAWSPLGAVAIYEADNEHPARHLLDETVPKDIGAAHGKSPAQVILRWHLQQGIAVIPKSVKPKRIDENADLFDFSLSDDEMRQIDTLETGVRGGYAPEEGSREQFPAVVID